MATKTSDQTFSDMHAAMTPEQRAQPVTTGVLFDYVALLHKELRKHRKRIELLEQGSAKGGSHG